MEPIINKIIQFGVVTPNTDETVKTLFELLNLGPFKVLGFKYPAIFDTTINNKPEPWTIKVAVGWIGDIPLEIIQPTGGKTYDEAYLEKYKHAGIQQLVMDNGKNSYAKTKEILAQAGMPVEIEAKTNIGFFIGPFRFPAFPMFLARCMATVFGYIDSFHALKVVIETSKYPLGVTPRSGIGMAAPLYWTPGNQKKFEKLPDNSLITNIEGFIVLVHDIAQVKPHYEKLFGNSSPTSTNELFYPLESNFIKVIQPEKHTAYEKILLEKGEGVSILMATPRKKSKHENDVVFREKGFHIIDIEEKNTIYMHHAMPFQIEVRL